MCFIIIIHHRYINKEQVRIEIGGDRTAGGGNRRWQPPKTAPFSIQLEIQEYNYILATHTSPAANLARWQWWLTVVVQANQRG